MAKPKKLTLKYLEILKPVYIEKNYPVPKWIFFSQALIEAGWRVELIRSKSTFSKYIYIHKGDKNFKIRFSNHKPNKGQQETNDCDFYVGISNGQVITTEMVLKKILGGM